MKQTLQDFGLHFEKVPMLCDNTTAISLSKNSIQHSRTNHIELRSHFIKTTSKREMYLFNSLATMANLLISLQSLLVKTLFALLEGN